MKTEKIKKRRFWLIIAAIFLAILIPALIYSNYHIDVENITFTHNDIPQSFSGTRIALLSDYHNKGGKYDDRLSECIASENPDYIFITGDIADRIFTNVAKTENFFRQISGIAPCYLVWGNHDKAISHEEFIKMKSYAESNEITILEGETIRLCKNNEYISVTGNYEFYNSISNAEKYEKDDFNIWLHHFPEDFEEISDITLKQGNQVDLMFSGHAHGGLIRFPVVGGLFAPGQGFFPAYDAGLCEYNGSSMIVSRGIGNSATTLRLFNPFHVVICTLEND